MVESEVTVIIPIRNDAEDYISRAMCVFCFKCTEVFMNRKVLKKCEHVKEVVFTEEGVKIKFAKNIEISSKQVEKNEVQCESKAQNENKAQWESVDDFIDKHIGRKCKGCE